MMPYFQYAKSTFFATADKVLRTTSGVAAALLALSGGASIVNLALARKNTGQLSDGSYKHFLADWQTSSGSGTVSFPNISPVEIDAVLTEGFRQAVKLANEKQLPVCSVWVCQADDETFEVVSVLNEGINVQVIVITPPPVVPAAPPKPTVDCIRVTRYFDTAKSLYDLRLLLQQLNSKEVPLVEAKDNGELTTTPGAGTFDILT